jgi:hypothetical protein
MMIGGLLASWLARLTGGALGPLVKSGALALLVAGAIIGSLWWLRADARHDERLVCVAAATAAKSAADLAAAKA